MNASIMLIPIFFIRYIVLGAVNKDALKRASHFAPLQGNEKMAYVIYQLSTVAIIVTLFFFRIETHSNWFYIGLSVFALGLVLYTVSVIDFAKPKSNGLNVNGLYRVSRNPMYVAYFVYFLGCTMLAQSWLLFLFVLVFQFSSHWIIRSEERWCIAKFGEPYIAYMIKVRRY